MSLFVGATLIIVQFVALGLLIAVVAYFVVGLTYAFIDKHATHAAVVMHQESRQPEPERAPATPSTAPNPDTARVA